MIRERKSLSELKANPNKQKFSYLFLFLFNANGKNIYPSRFAFFSCINSQQFRFTEIIFHLENFSFSLRSCLESNSSHFQGWNARMVLGMNGGTLLIFFLFDVFLGILDFDERLGCFHKICRSSSMLLFGLRMGELGWAQLSSFKAILSGF